MQIYFKGAPSSMWVCDTKVLVGYVVFSHANVSNTVSSTIMYTAMRKDMAGHLENCNCRQVIANFHILNE